MATLAALTAGPALAAGKIRGKVVGGDTGELLSFADVILFPADTTQKKIGGLTNVDGTFLLEAPAGTYTLQIRLMSYRPKRITAISIEDGKLFELSATLESEAIQQKEIVVETRAVQNTDNALMAQRRKSSTVGDAVSAEQVRKSPDKDAGEVLRRVTGLNVEDGKYVFVRGLGERYSSTEVDGVRLSSPETNKRVVPLDLLPASLVDNIVVQKTYSADRPAEFGGGDVQVKTKDFPGKRTVAFSVSQGTDEGTTGKSVLNYAGTGRDIWALGADSRRLPDIINQLAANKKLVPQSRFDPTLGLPKSQLVEMAQSFSDEWSTGTRKARPNTTYQASYGDEVRLFGRSLGTVATGTYRHDFESRDEIRRLFTDTETRYDLDVTRSVESVQLGGKAGLSYRVSPAHALHLRGVYTRSMDDEARQYSGYDGERQANQRGTRLMYLERAIYTAGLEGNHEFAGLMKSRLTWRGSLNGATRKQPDRRESIYEEYTYVDDNDNPVTTYNLRSQSGTAREYGELEESGDGFDIANSLPVRFSTLGSGKLDVGFSYQFKRRDNYYRRFEFRAASGTDTSAPPESLFQASNFDTNSVGNMLIETTYPDDNYNGYQKQTAGFVSVEVPGGPRVRSVLGVRLEKSEQLVRSFDLFEPTKTTALGQITTTDVLPSANITWSATDRVNLRLAASRTLSRPDLRELSPARAIEFVGGLRAQGNAALQRASINNYDVRIEFFPGASEVVAAGVFLKEFDDPIEQVIRPGDAPFYEPQNSESGRNRGIELELRTGLGRLWQPLERFFLNTNFSAIQSQVYLKPQLTTLGSTQHPLQGQADRLFNAGLTYALKSGAADATFLVSYVGRRLESLGVAPLQDIYEQPVTTYDAAFNMRLMKVWRLKLAGKNLTDETYTATQGLNETLRYQPGRGFSLTLAYGS